VDLITFRGEVGESNPVPVGGAGKHFAACERIMQCRPLWFVMWGPANELYWAFPVFLEPALLWGVRDPDPFALIARMDELERMFGLKPRHEGR
jgi:hypothetical protein